MKHSSTDRAQSPPAPLLHALDTGRVVERGRHDALLALDGRYAQMWRRQQKRMAFAPTIRSGEGCRNISVIAVSDGFGLA